MKEIDIYTDAAGTRNCFGVSMLTVTYDGQIGKESLYSEYIEIDDISDILNLPISYESDNISTAEMWAIIKSLSMIPIETKCKINVYTDNMHSFILLNKISRHKCPALNKMIQIYDFYRENLNIEVMWIKGHVKTWGNQIVDKAAKSVLKKMKRKNMYI